MMKHVSAKVAKVLPKNLKIDVNPTYEGVTQNDVDSSLLLLSYVQLVYLKVAELLEYLSSYGVSICLGISQVTHEDVLTYKRNSEKSMRTDKYIIQDIFFKYVEYNKTYSERKVTNYSGYLWKMPISYMFDDTHC